MMRTYESLSSWEILALETALKNFQPMQQSAKDSLLRKLENASNIRVTYGGQPRDRGNSK